jgi:hypothetical protein
LTVPSAQFGRADKNRRLPIRRQSFLKAGICETVQQPRCTCAGPTTALPFYLLCLGAPAAENDHYPYILQVPCRTCSGPLSPLCVNERRKMLRDDRMAALDQCCMCRAALQSGRLPPTATGLLRLRTTPEDPQRITAKSNAAGLRFASLTALDGNDGRECGVEGRLRRIGMPE